MSRYAGLEMGGTKTIAVLGTPGAIIDRVEFPTTSPEETLAIAAHHIAAWHREASIRALGIASFGPVRLDTAARDFGTILDTPKPGWRGTRIVDAIAEVFGGPIQLDTDVNAAALAEARIGAGQGLHTLIYLTIGTGVGGGVLINGKTLHGVMHPEIGHMRLRRAADDRFAGICPFHGGCVEGLVSGPALQARFGVHPSTVALDDPRWGRVASDLAELFANLLCAFSPQRIIVGGGVSVHQPHLLRMAIDHLPERLGGYLGPVTGADLRSRIVPAQLGNDAGPTGSLYLAMAAAGD